jgi:hypothetical protein
LGRKERLQLRLTGREGGEASLSSSSRERLSGLGPLRLKARLLV